MTQRSRASVDRTPVWHDASWKALLQAASDLSILSDRQGLILDVVVGKATEDLSGLSGLVGRKWSDVVAEDSRAKVSALLAGARPVVSPAREVNLRVAPERDVPFRFSSLRSEEEGPVLLVGRDLRQSSELQQKMVELQQATEREYARLRQTDTRYRLFFHASSEAVLVVEAAGLRVVEVNPAAAALLERSPQELLRAHALDFLAPSSRTEVQSLLGAIVSGGRLSDLAVQLQSPARHLMLSASLFTQSGVAYAVLRLSSPTESRTSNASVRTSRMQGVLDALPDGFVVVGENRRVLSANPAFCELVRAANEKQIIGEPIDRWLGRAGVDLNIMVANLREHGSIRNFPTIVRGDVGAPQEALVTAVEVTEGKLPCTGFLIRIVSPRLFAAPSTLPRSIDQLRELVGRVPLKEIVRESADLLERMCIEAALDVSGDNRASAAQLLGLSRQGLYSKLRRYGLGSPVDPS